MKPHPKTGRTIREEAEFVAGIIENQLANGILASNEAMIERAILRYAAPKYTKNGNGNGNGHTKEPPDARVPIFVDWFYEQYYKYRGAAYSPNFPQDCALAKRLLKTLSLPELQDCAIILLDERTDDKFIQESDRGIGMLSTKINWLNQRRAMFLARQMRQR